MPSGSVQVAPVGQTFVHGALRHCWHATGHVEVALLGHLVGLVVRVGVREVDALLLLHREHADPVHLRVARLVVLLDARVDAAPAADAARDVERVARTRRRAAAARPRRSPPCRTARAYSRSISPKASLQALAAASRAGASGRSAVSSQPAAAAAAHEANCRRRDRRRALRPDRHRASPCASPAGPRWAARGAGFGAMRLEARLVRVVAVRAEQVASCGRSTVPSAGRARRRASRAASRRGTGRTAGTTPRTAPALAARQVQHVAVGRRRGSRGTSGAARRA